MDAISKGKAASRLLNDPLLQEALQGMKAAAFAGIESSLSSEHEKRTDLYYLLRAINQFDQILTNFIHSGSIAQNDIKETVLRTIIR